METIFKYDVQIQQAVVLLFVIIFFAGIILGRDFFFPLIIIVFFLLATVQYTLNMMKFLNKNYLKTDSRKAYMFISTCVVISFLAGVCSAALNIQALENIMEIMVVSWLVLSPVLIVLSLLISHFDVKNKRATNPNIGAQVDHHL